MHYSDPKNAHECVALVLALHPDLRSPVPNKSAMDFWTPGVKVALAGQPNSALQPGTAIATFTSGGPAGFYPANGKMPDQSMAHTGVFVEYGHAPDGRLGFYMLDQYATQPAEVRFHVFNAAADEYYAIVSKSKP